MNENIKWNMERTLDGMYDKIREFERNIKYNSEKVIKTDKRYFEELETENNQIIIEIEKLDNTLDGNIIKILNERSEYLQEQIEYTEKRINNTKKEIEDENIELKKYLDLKKEILTKYPEVEC